ncbi:hypothetical protein M9H77_15463 [Catharanthus roseus]|uniref:Uncharacterized protein n=1 Tax=Catharanthus roseus TaxID=4058 RepID=A0ACC0AZ45_CATRO|nr:hypothetical protein M9H77_15463 [Catharanthus roseus]
MSYAFIPKQRTICVQAIDFKGDYALRKLVELTVYLDCFLWNSTIKRKNTITAVGSLTLHTRKTCEYGRNIAYSHNKSSRNAETLGMMAGNLLILGSMLQNRHSALIVSS